MMKVFASLALALVAANPVAAQCDYDFCPDGITYPTAIVNPTDPVAEQAACSLVPLGILTNQLSAEECAELPALELVCCPPAGPLPCGNTTIEFCPNGSIEDPNAVVNPTDPVEDQLPCGFVTASIGLGFIPDEDCSSIAFVEAICCPAKNETMVPIEDPTIPPTDPATDPATEDDSCYFCGSNVPFNAEKGFGGEDVCAQFDELLADLPGGDFCDNFITELITEEGINFRSFCECEGVAAPDICKVCPEGQELVPGNEIPGAEGLTCGAGADYIKHVTNATGCGEFVTSEAQAACCVTKEDPSSATSLTMSALATGLLLVLAFAI